MTKLRPIRAEGHRSFIGVEFGGPAPVGDAEPAGLNYLQVLADPKLAYLGRQVFDQLRQQFAGDSVFAESSEEEQYRLRLEGWADALEILLEEVLEELATLKGSRASAQADEQPVLI